MEKALNRVCTCLTQMAAGKKVIAEYLLSKEEVMCLMGLVDVRRKGYLDLHDVYELVGKVTETQLFTLFKTMDIRKTGQVTEEDLMAIIGDPSSQSSSTCKQYLFRRFYKVIDTIKDRPSTLTTIKQQYNFNKTELEVAFNVICSKSQTRHPTVGDVAKVLKQEVTRQGVEWGQCCESTLRQVLPWGGALRTEQFTEAWLVKEQKTKDDEVIMTPATVAAPAENLTHQVQSSDCQPTQSTFYQPTQSTFYQKIQLTQPTQSTSYQPTQSKLYQKTQLTQPNQTTFYPKAQPCRKTSAVSRDEHKQWEGIQSSVNSTLTSIQQRRQKLRQDSIQRKKLIETVLTNKRQSCGVQHIAPAAQIRPSTPKTYLKHSASAQLHKNSWEPIRPPSPTPAYAEMGRFQTQHDRQPTSVWEPNSSLKESRKYDIAEIIGKYSNPSQNTNHSAYPRSLNKSKSSMLGQHVHSSGAEGHSGTRLTLGCKENVLKRAEEEAARKIEEIEKKARMRVLEKRGGEWSRLQKKKRGIPY